MSIKKKKIHHCIILNSQQVENNSNVYQLKNIQNIYTTEYYSTIKRNEVLIHITVSLNLEKIMQSERIQTERPYFV